MAEFIEFITDLEGTRQSFNADYIVKLAKRDKDDFTFMDMADWGDRKSITRWTIYEKYKDVVKKLQVLK